MRNYFAAILLLTLAGCAGEDDVIRACDQSCRPRLMKSWAKDTGCVCDTVMQPAPVLFSFCERCKVSCAPLLVHSCKDANEVWGAGPNVCECKPTDGGTRP